MREKDEKFADAIKLALPYLGDGPPLQAFGIAREDCALAHIDYFGGIAAAASVLCGALAELEGIEPSEVYRKYGGAPTACDCESCTSAEEAEAASERHRAAYTNVKEWRAADV